MKYEITLNDKTTKTIHADSLLDAEIYVLCMYKDKVFGGVIKSLESDDVLWLPVLSYTSAATGNSPALTQPKWRKTFSS